MRKYYLCFLVLILAGCNVSAPTNQDADQINTPYCDGDEGKTCTLDDEVADMSAYKDFDTKNSMFQTSSMDAVLKTFQQKKSGVFYFGFPLCPWCVEALPIMNEAAKEKNIHIQYVRTRDDNKELLYTQKQKAELIPYVNDFLEKDDDGNVQLFVPFVLVINDGVAVSGHVGTVDGYDTKVRKMTDKEKQKLKSVYKSMLP